MELKPEIVERIPKLEQKYAAMGQDMAAYLDGLLLSNYLTYWDYVHTDKLLNLQNPRTDFPDELIFIVYHQITELNFKLCLHELQQIAYNGKNIAPNGKDEGWKNTLEVPYFIDRINRVNRYFESLTKSFDIMVDGMDPEQFSRFRMALLPASGFQSAQYRMIEISCADMINLVDKDHRDKFPKGGSHSIEEMYQYIYWKQGATEAETGKKTLTLKQFEEKYSEEFVTLAKEYASRNLWAKYTDLPKADQENKDLIAALRELDLNVNVRWPLVHYKSAARYLQSKSGDAPATGGTNWQKYLPPRFQKRIFYPALWTAEELENWGRF